MNDDPNFAFAVRFRAVVRKALLSEAAIAEKSGTCPDDASLKTLALDSGVLHDRGLLTEHIVQCSRCYRIVERWRRRRRLGRVAAGCSLVAAVAAGLTIPTEIDRHRVSASRPRNRSDAPDAASMTDRGGTVSAPSTMQNGRVVSGTASVILEPASTRSAQIDRNDNSLAIEDGVSQVQIFLDLAQDAQSLYIVLLQTIDGVDVQRFEGISSVVTADGGRAVPLKIPTRQLNNGTYIFRVYRQFTDERHFVNAYSLRVVR